MRLTHHFISLFMMPPVRCAQRLIISDGCINRGYQRAVIIRQIVSTHTNVTRLVFRNQPPSLPSRPLRQRTPWPAKPRNIPQIQPMFTQVQERSSSPACAWSIGVTEQHIQKFFTSAEDILSRSFDGLTLPQHVQDALDSCVPLDTIYRIVIYTDGSSKPEHRRRQPLQVESEEHGDTWAFVAIGEQFTEGDQSRINVTGWTAHPVLYDDQAAHHIGSCVVGSETAEREAMFWSGAWRLAQNCNVPTAFCSDSHTAGRQADGHDGANSPDEYFCHLRAIFQCLVGSLQEGLAISNMCEDTAMILGTILLSLPNRKVRKAFITAVNNWICMFGVPHSSTFGCESRLTQAFLLLMAVFLMSVPQPAQTDASATTSAIPHESGSFQAQHCYCQCEFIAHGPCGL